VAGHTTEEQQRSAPASAFKNGILAFSVSLSLGQFLKAQDFNHQNML
jgi:hypothetical protein